MLPTEEEVVLGRVKYDPEKERWVYTDTGEPYQEAVAEHSNPKIWQEELGGIRHIWVRLPNRSAVSVGRADENLSDDEVILRAKRYWEREDRIEKASATLRAEYPERGTFHSFLPQPDIFFIGDEGDYVYVLKKRKREGKDVVEKAIKVG